MASVTYGKSIMSSVINGKNIMANETEPLIVVHSVHCTCSISNFDNYFYFLRKLEASACDMKSTICKATKSIDYYKFRYIYKVVISVCLFVFPIITHKP